MAFRKRNVLSTLQDILDKGRMSVTLRKAVAATASAIEAGDYELAYQISACKSLVCGEMDTGRNRQDHFREDGDANEKALGGSIYMLLDGVHFKLAMKVGKLSSGMMVVSRSPEGLSMEEMRHEGEHPIVRRIQSENRRIAKEVEEMTRRKS